jgi:predicted GIY-YIG superfamily endonuclease
LSKKEKKELGKADNCWYTKQWYCYILESLTKEHMSYIGITTDPKHRADEHNKRTKGHKG